MPPKSYKGKRDKKSIINERYAIGKRVDKLEKDSESFKEFRTQIGTIVVQIVAIILAVIGVISGVILFIASKWDFNGDIRVALLIILGYLAFIETVRIGAWIYDTFVKFKLGSLIKSKIKTK